MPRRRRRRPVRRRRRRASRGRPARRRRRNTVARIRTFPATRIVKVRYVQRAVLTTATPITDVVWKGFRANGPGTPEASGGHQPRGWDEWTTLYSKYRCLSSTIDVKMINDIENLTSLDTGVLVLKINDSDTDPLDGSAADSAYHDQAESRGVGYKFVTQAGNGVGRMRGSYNLQKFWRGRQGPISVQTAAMGAIPPSGNRCSYWVGVAQTGISTGTGRPFEILVTIEYICKLTDRVTIGRS